MLTIVVDQMSEIQRFEINCEAVVPPGQPMKLMEMVDGLLKGDNTLVLTGALAEDAVIRVCRRVREKAYPPEVLNIVVRWEWQGIETLTAMPVNEHGDFVKGWPGGFFDHRLDELF